MNLDLLPIGWVHLGASLLALAAGTLVLLRPKGTPVHKWRGRLYAFSLLVTNVTALGAASFSFRTGWRSLLLSS